MLLVEETATLLACSPKSLFDGERLDLVPAGVEVPCALM